MARYKMTVVFDAHEEVEMKYVVKERSDGELSLAQEASEVTTLQSSRKRQPHINNLFEDVLERIDTSPKHQITYDIISFEKLKDE
jgi:hypothetical protein